MKLFRRKHPNAGWECLACGHQERCTNRKTFWQDVGATLNRHNFEHHPQGMDYVAHVPRGWERRTTRKDTP